MSYRFRVDDRKLVLQVYQPPKRSSYSYDYERDGEWRDAKVEDIPVADPFRNDPPPSSYFARCAQEGSA